LGIPESNKVDIFKYLDEKLVHFFEATSRDEAIEQLVDVLDQRGKLANKALFKRAVLQREKLVSTGIGISVAIPHAKLEGYSDFFIAIGIQKGKSGIDWNALDGLPVRLIFMIGGPENRQPEYLKILSRLTEAIKDEERRKKVLKARTAKEVVDLFQGW
jgi:PTS system nitrogen regulatory IIA component